MDSVKDYEMTTKGLSISHGFLERAGLGDEVEVFARDHTIIIKPKSMTDRVRGIVKKSPLNIEELDELYHTSKGL